MSKNYKYLLVTLGLGLCVVVAFIGIKVGYNYMNDQKLLEKPNIETNIKKAIDDNDIIVVPIPEDIPKIKQNTNLIYQYLHEEDGEIESSIENAPYFLIDKTESELQELFEDWTILSFSENEVILQKTVEGSSNQHYIVGVLDGYVAIFYKNPINGTNLKEITSTPVSVLPIEEQEKLLSGINVNGEDALIRILEDYGS